MSWVGAWTLAGLLSATAAPQHQAWTTRLEFRTADRLSSTAAPSAAGDGSGTTVRVDSAGLRIVVTDSEVRGLALAYATVAAWLPGGTMVRAYEPTEGMPDLGPPGSAQVHREGVWVRYRRHYVRYSWPGLAEQVLELPPDPSIRAVLPDGSVVASSRLPPPRELLGWTGGTAAPQTMHLLHLRRSETGAWSRDTVAVLDMRRRVLGVRFDDGTDDFPAAHYSTQPFGDFDLRYVVAAAGRVGVVRRNLPPGRVEIVEVAVPGGDTLWQRVLTLPPVPLPRQHVEAEIGALAAAVLDRTSPELAGRKAREALYAPTSFPPARAVVPTVSGELWIATHESADSMSVWYAVAREESERAPRRVLLPAWFQLGDATSTHVWGVRPPADGEPRQVLGLRLVPPRQPGRQPSILGHASRLPGGSVLREPAVSSSRLSARAGASPGGRRRSTTRRAPPSSRRISSRRPRSCGGCG